MPPTSDGQAEARVRRLLAGTPDPGELPLELSFGPVTDAEKLSSAEVEAKVELTSLGAMRQLSFPEPNQNHQRRFFTVVLPSELAPFDQGETCLVRFHSGPDMNFKAEVSKKKQMRLEQVDHELARKSLGPRPVVAWNKKRRRWGKSTLPGAGNLTTI